MKKSLFLLMKYSIITLSAIILFGCASSTVIKTLPDGAKVEKDGQFLGITPYEIWDRAVSDTVTTYTLKKEGYKNREIAVKKDVFYVHRLFLPPLLSLPWLFGYPLQYSFELEKSEETTTEAAQSIPAASNLGIQPKISDPSEYGQKLRQLKNLKDENLISDHEYELKRKAIIDGM